MSYLALKAKANMHIDAFGRRHRYGPPAGYRPPAQEVFCVDAEWSRLVERGLQFPAYSGPTTRFAVRGNCLEPLVTDRHMLLTRPVDPAEALTDGGLYAIRWDNEIESQIYRDSIGISTGGHIVIAKFLRFVAGEWWCLCADNLTPLLDNLIIGAIVAVLPLTGCAPQAEVHARSPICGNPFDSSSVACSGLGANAATSIDVATASGSTNLSNNSAITVVSLTVGPFLYDVQLVATGTGEWAFSTTSNADVLQVWAAISEIAPGTSLADSPGSNCAESER
jgi:hypothetical protein